MSHIYTIIHTVHDAKYKIWTMVKDNMKSNQELFLLPEFILYIANETYIVIVNCGLGERDRLNWRNIGHYHRLGIIRKLGRLAYCPGGAGGEGIRIKCRTPACLGGGGGSSHVYP